MRDRDMGGREGEGNKGGSREGEREREGSRERGGEERGGGGEERNGGGGKDIGDGGGRERERKCGKTKGSMLQHYTSKNLTTSPFGNTYEVDVVSAEVAIGGCRT